MSESNSGMYSVDKLDLGKYNNPAYYYLVDESLGKASSFFLETKQASALLDLVSEHYKEREKIGSLKKSTLLMYVFLKPDLTIKELVEILSGVPPVLS